MSSWPGADAGMRFGTPPRLVSSAVSSSSPDLGLSMQSSSADMQRIAGQNPMLRSTPSRRTELQANTGRWKHELHESGATGAELQPVLEKICDLHRMELDSVRQHLDAAHLERQQQVDNKGNLGDVVRIEVRASISQLQKELSHQLQHVAADMKRSLSDESARLQNQVEAKLSSFYDDLTSQVACLNRPPSKMELAEKVNASSMLQLVTQMEQSESEILRTLGDLKASLRTNLQALVSNVETIKESLLTVEVAISPLTNLPRLVTNVEKLKESLLSVEMAMSPLRDKMDSSHKGLAQLIKEHLLSEVIAGFEAKLKPLHESLNGKHETFGWYCDGPFFIRCLCSRLRR